MSEAVTLSLISHTNVGKTTLARTLLKRDLGCNSRTRRSVK